VSGQVLVGESVIDGAGGTFLKRQPEKLSSIEPMNRGPAIASLAHVRRNTLFARDAYECWKEAVIAFAVHRWSKTHDRHVHPARGRCQRCCFRFAGKIRVGRIIFGCGPALGLSQQCSGSDDEWTLGACQRVAENFYGAPVRLGSRPIVREIVIKSGVDYSIGSPCSAAKA